MRTWQKAGTAFLAGLATILFAARPAPARQAKPEKAKVIEELTLPELRSVLGTPRDDGSGVSDYSLGGQGEVIIAYRYYDIDLDNFETDFAAEIAPKLQTLYRRFKSLDRVRFEIVANEPSAAPPWKPFSAFTMDRATIEKLRWTWFVSRDVLDQVLKNRK